jgi:hypothetical protein
MVIPVRQKAIPTVRIHEDRDPRPRRPKNNADRALEAYFAVMIMVILGSIIGLTAYAVHTVIPEWQKSHSPRNLQYPLNVLFESHSPERR